MASWADPKCWWERLAVPEIALDCLGDEWRGRSVSAERQDLPEHRERTGRDAQNRGADRHSRRAGQKLTMIDNVCVLGKERWALRLLS